MSATKRAAIYARVSTEMQEREGTSLESQAARCLDYARERGWSVDQVVQEQGSGGDVGGRSKLQNLLALAKAGQIDAVVCYHIDRFSRDVDDQGWLKTEFRKAGVELAFVTGESNRILQAVQGAMAQDELEKIRERTTRGKAQTAVNGKYLPGHAPYGYRHRRVMVGSTLKVVGLDEDPVTAPILREMFEFVARGGTATGCAAWLNSQGIPPSRGVRWRHTSICAVLHNPVYKGQPHALRYQARRDELTRKRRMKGRPASEWVALPSEIAPALVSPDIWQRANDQLVAAQTGARRNSSEPELYLLRAGFLRCGNCGGAMCGLRVGDVPTYVCKQRAANGCRSSGSMRARELDGVVWDMVTAVLKDPAWIRQQLEEQADGDSLDERVAQQQANLRRLEQEERRLAARLGDLDDPTPVIARLNGISARRKTIEAELDELLFQQRHAEQIARRLNGFDRRFLDAYERVDTMGYDERRAVLRQFNVQVTLWKRDHDPRFAIDWAFDLGDDWWQTDLGEDDGSWIIYTRESASPSATEIAYSSSA